MVVQQPGAPLLRFVGGEFFLFSVLVHKCVVVVWHSVGWSGVWHC